MSKSLSFLSSVYDIPQISSSSTTSTLDDTESHPLFGRTVPSSDGDAKAMAMYLAQQNITHVAILYISDDYGRNYHASFAQEANRRGISVYPVGYEDATMHSATQQLANSGMRYIVGILQPSTWQELVRSAINAGVMGKPGYTWLLAESSSEFVNPAFSLSQGQHLTLQTHSMALGF